MVGCGGDLGFGGLEKLLVALVDQAGDLAADQDAWFGKKTHPTIGGLLNGGRAVQFFQEDAVLRPRGFQDVKSMIAKPAYSFFIRAFIFFSLPLPHLTPFDSRPIAAVARKNRVRG